MYNVITGELYAEIGKIMETREPYMTERLDGEDVISDEAMNRTRQLIAKMRKAGYHDRQIWDWLAFEPETLDELGYSITLSDLIAIIGKMEEQLAWYEHHLLDIAGRLSSVCWHQPTNFQHPNMLRVPVIDDKDELELPDLPTACRWEFRVAIPRDSLPDDVEISSEPLPSTFCVLSPEESLEWLKERLSPETLDSYIEIDPLVVLDVGTENDYHTSINLAGALE